MTEEKDKVNTEEHEHDEDDHHKLDLRGTFMMVMAIGGLMLLSWFGAFILFMERI
ncbi:MAG: cytochrome c oxidase subunit 2A [Jeotgalicoccus sp.]